MPEEFDNACDVFGGVEVVHMSLYPPDMMARGGCCRLLHLHEDNARFILLAIVMVLYMLAGATVFMLLERDNEIEERNHYYHILETFLHNNPSVNKSELEILLDAHADAATAGLLDDKRDRWDYAGSFYFVGTVVSTIGKLFLSPLFLFLCLTPLFPLFNTKLQTAGTRELEHP